MSFIDEIREKGFLIADMKGKQFSAPPVETRFDVILLCHNGTAELEINMNRIQLKPRSCLVYSRVLYGNTISVSNDFWATVLLLDSTFSFDASVGIPAEFMHNMITEPVREIDDDNEWAMLNNMMDIIRLNNRRNPLTYRREMVEMQYRSMLFTLAESATNTQRSRVREFTMGDSYFRNFMNLIETHVKEHHEVAFYAEQLHITPKYLSEICKQKSGYKAKEILSAVLVANIKKDIMVSGKSMKVLAFEYCFADQSSLGKFFRKMTGKSPMAFRKEKH